MTDAWPTELRIDRAARVLEVDFDDGRRYRLPAELLRVESPSAEVKGHGAGDRRLVGGKRQVGIADVEAVGNYAIRILFDDGHDTGIFSWRYLAELGAGQDEIWRRYLDAIAAAGLSRDA